MSSVVVSSSSSDGPSQATGGEGNPIELDDSSTNINSENENENELERPPGPLFLKEEGNYSDPGDNDDDDESEDESESNRDDESGEDADKENSEGEGDGDDEMMIDAGQTMDESGAEGDDSENENKSDDEDEDEEEEDDENDDDNGDDGDSDDSGCKTLATKDSEDASTKERKRLKRMKYLWGNIDSMAKIVKSPYEGNECAEVGEDCFEEFRLLMDTSQSDGKVNPQMVALVGDKLARDLCNAHHEIGKSGMLYSANWKEGKIRDSDFGWIPKRQLLLCLHEHRFAKGDVILLQAVNKNLDCTKLVQEAMKLWDLMDAYPNLASNKNEETFSFGPQKVFCYKCQIFVARAFATLQILNKTEAVQQSLTRKIKACLNVMNKHVRVNQIELARMRKKGEKRKALEAPISEEPNADVGKNHLSRGGNSGNSGGNSGPKPRGPSAKKTTRKRRRKIPKREEREESIFMLFSTMNTQVQRLNQMMSFFQSQLQDHRGILREEIRENL